MAGRIPVPSHVNAFMERHMRTFMLTLRRDGSPTGHPMSGFYGEGLYLNMYRVSPKARNLERDKRVCCVVTMETVEPGFKGVVYRGEARRVTPEEAFAEKVGRGLLRARTAGAVGVSASAERDQEALNRVNHAAERTRQGVRVVYEIVPHEAGFLEEVRGDAGAWKRARR